MIYLTQIMMNILITKTYIIWIRLDPGKETYNLQE